MKYEARNLLQVQKQNEKSIFTGEKVKIFTEFIFSDLGEKKL